MYETHWGLDRPPFPSGLDATLFYEGTSQRESLARLRFLLAHRRRFGLVLGEAGLGKSLLLEMFASHCRRTGLAAAKVDLLGLSAREFYWQLGNRLQGAVRVEDDMLRLFRQLCDRLQQNQLQSTQTVLLLDDLDRAGPDLFNQLLRLTRTNFANHGWLTIVATANSNRLSQLPQEIFELVDLRVDLTPWDELDTIGYLQLALFEAGAERPLFDDDAMTALHHTAAGVPRAVNRIADFALLAGSSSGRETINAETIQAACEAVNVPVAS